MNLEISHVNNIYKLRGTLNRRNVKTFQKELSDAFEKLNAIILSVEELESIDRYGVNALAQLHNESLAQKKSLSIIGYGCKDLYNYFKAESAA